MGLTDKKVNLEDMENMRTGSLCDRRLSSILVRNKMADS
eukprot:CAMPEP_0116933284 /NCGR_PEP_ID=MMETSP0467-20121206/28948_1 /TAXON_ID=283647 /ORGANISM="Mesodinium pulex, Strain SPMC105" /LENGTH=38 /DNA_ID= /DNA_START= /DNA_END= /DNA_ORIENTATION=